MLAPLPLLGTSLFGPRVLDAHFVVPLFRYRGQHCSAVLGLDCAFVFVTFLLAWSHDQNCHGGALGDKPEKIVNLRNLRSSFWFFVLGL